MSWVKLDDKFYSHPKVASIENKMLEAVGLHTLALSWSAAQLTDGFIPRPQAARLAGGNVDDLISALLQAGLWDNSERGYQIHDYLDYNPSREQVLAQREAQKEAGRRTAALRWGRSTDRSTDSSSYSSTDRSPHSSPVAPPIGDGVGDECSRTRTRTHKSKSLEEPPEFGAFWSLYPRRVSKGQAQRALAAALKKTDINTILAALERQLPDLNRREKKYIPYPSTWLNGERWEDDVTVAPTEHYDEANEALMEELMR